jgi:phosphoribosylamine--glycine ligase
MKVLVVGGGGREHALAWKISRSAEVKRVYCAPGNAGTAAVSENVQIPATDLEALTAFVKEHQIDLTVVGPEDPLCRGLVNRLNEQGHAAFGPTAAAARLEGSKAFCKQLMRELGIPTAPFEVVSDMDRADTYLKSRSNPQVVKADGLAAGKGVVVCNRPGEAVAAAREMLLEERFGSAGSTLVIEDRLEGEEASFMALSDGERVVPLASSQDHKRALDGDRGPNTGGMGAYSPAPVVTGDRAQQIMETIVRPLARGMAVAGTPYRGVVYAGLMINGDDIQVLEINCRFGDPETQPVLMRLDEDLVPLMRASSQGELTERGVRTDPRATLCVVMAASGYPGAYQKGDPIQGLAEVDALEDVQVFHAGTRLDDRGQVVTGGGRVLGVTAYGETIAAAHQRAYEAVGRITWRDVQYRKDIGHRAL